MEYLGFFAAIVIGILLGLIGAGGSILTIPVLVYLIGIQPLQATSYSLFIVGVSAIIGGLRYFKNNMICLKTMVVFGLPSVISIFFTRKYLLYMIPDHLFFLGSLDVTKSAALMLLLAIMMILASYSMIKKTATESQEMPKHHIQQYRYFLISLQGIFVGLLVGLVGAGGGFLIIPALVVLAKLPMKMAVGTSLAIIAMNSSIGFLSDFGTHYFDWTFLLIFSSFAISGILIGSYLSKYVSGLKLKPVFGWFILLMGVYIISKELFL
jgi:uncharacterized membrane protein YfcA